MRGEHVVELKCRETAEFFFFWERLLRKREGLSIFQRRRLQFFEGSKGRAEREEKVRKNLKNYKEKEKAFEVYLLT